MDKVAAICFFAAAVAALVLILWYRRRMTLTMDRLRGMLDEAIDGSFQEGSFDESRLSAIEAKMARYLVESGVSSKNLLAEKEKIKSLISDISHQTKTPIANILLYSQLLSEHQLPEDCRVCVEALSSQAEKLSFLISALVKSSRLETGIISVAPKEESVQTLLDAVAEQAAPRVQAKSIVLELPRTEDRAFFDLKWTAEALYNIVDNAVKYSPEGSVIRITAAPYELFYRIDVADEGRGIEEEELPKIFGRFYRSPAVAGLEGVGIGLFLTREILSAEGGYIKAASSPGKGSVFSMFLPRGR